MVVLPGNMAVEAGEMVHERLFISMKWALFQIEWRKKRNASIRRVEFHFALGRGQKDLVVIGCNFHLKKALCNQAPTGVGKTVTSVCFPR